MPEQLWDDEALLAAALQWDSKDGDFFDKHPRGPAMKEKIERRVEAGKQERNLDDAYLQLAPLQRKDFRGWSLKRALRGAQVLRCSPRRPSLQKFLNDSKDFLKF